MSHSGMATKQISIHVNRSSHSRWRLLLQISAIDLLFHHGNVARKGWFWDGGKINRRTLNVASEEPFMFQPALAEYGWLYNHSKHCGDLDHDLGYQYHHSSIMGMSRARKIISAKFHRYYFGYG